MPAQSTEIVEILPADRPSAVLSLSPDGRNVLLQSNGLTADDLDSGSDLYAWNVNSRTFQLIGQEIAGGIEGNGVGPAEYSPDGRYIAFVSDGQLSVDDTNQFIDDEGREHSFFDVYLYDTVTGVVTLVTPSIAGATEPTFFSLSFSADSSTLVIETDAKAAAEDTDGGGYDVYGYDIATAQLSAVGNGEGGYVLLGGGITGGVQTSISADGRWIAVESNQQLTTDDANLNLRDVYLYDSQTGNTVLASNPVPGGLEGASALLDMSADGSKLLIWSYAQLSSEDTDGGLADVYLWNRATGATTLVTKTDPGDVDGAAVGFGSISDDGTLVVFSTAAKLTPEDVDSQDDVYSYRVATATTELLSVTSPGGAEGGSYGQLSDDGTVVLINGWAQLTAGDTDIYRDAYLLDLATGLFTLASADVPNGNSQDYAGRSPDLDTRVLWLSPTFGENFYRWDAATQSTIAIPRDSQVPIGFEFSADGSAVGFTDYPSGASYWFGVDQSATSGITLHGGKTNDPLVGTAGNDSLYGGPGNDTLSGLGGNDRLFGEKDRDLIHGGDGDDLVYGGRQNDKLFGDDGNDRLYGDIGTIERNGTGANDRVDGGAGADQLFGDAGTIDSGTGGRDDLSGGTGDDRLYGDARTMLGRSHGGDDILRGGGGNDVLFGDAEFTSAQTTGGNDRLDGGSGSDGLWGGGGNDIFIFSSKGFGADTIFDFGQAAGNDDSIDLHAFATSFAALTITYSDEGATVTSAAFGTGSIFLVGVDALTTTDFLF